MNNSSTPRRRMRRPAAADYIGSSQGFLEKAAVTGDGPPYIRLSARLVVYDVADLDEWMAARRVRSSAEAAERERTAVCEATEDRAGRERTADLRTTAAPPHDTRRARCSPTIVAGAPKALSP